MCSDRELLELAARAAGLLLCGYSWIGENEDDEECEIIEAAFVKHRQEQGLASKWNPLTDDGDALRLAVRLGIEFHMEGDEESECVWANEIFEWTDGDSIAATRRAIVRAAAAIGEAMQ